MLIANRSHDDSADATNNYLQKYTIISELILQCIFQPYSGLKKDQVKEKLRSSNYMMDPPANYMRHDRER